MSHWGRRLWRWSAALFALLVVLLAALVGVIRLATPLVPSYRAQVEAWASAAIQHPVEIQSMGAEWGWHGPEVALMGVRILSRDRGRVVVSAEEVHLGVSLMGLVQGSLPHPDRIVLVGPQAEIHRNAQGLFSIAGLEGGVQQAPTDWRANLREVFAQSAVLVVKKGMITYVEAGAPRPMLFQNVDLELDNAAASHKLEGDMQLPAEFGRSLSFTLKVDGEGIDPDQWDWQAEADGTGLQLPHLLRYWKPYAALMERGSADIEVDVRCTRGDLQKLGLTLNALDLVPAPKTNAALMAGAFQSVAGKLEWSRSETGWMLTGRKLQFGRGTQLWPKTDLNLEYAKDAGGSNWSGSAGFLRLQDLTALAAWVPPDSVEGLQRLFAFTPTGDVTDTAFKLRKNGDTLGDWSAKASFQDLGVHKAEGWPGFSGMSGKLDLSQAGGSVTLVASGAGVDFTPLFRWPMYADSLQLVAKVTHDQRGWQVGTGDFRVSNRDGAAHGSASMQFPVGGAAPRLDLDAVVERGNAKNKSLYFPVGIMPKDVVKWLDDAIVAGSVDSGSVSIHGDLSDFPFRDNKGIFDIRFHLLHGELNYADGWPALKDLDADVRFLDQSLEAKARGGKVLGDDIVEGTARFADLNTGVLQVDGNVKGDASNGLNFLRSSPMRPLIGAYLDPYTAAGPSDASLHLVLPVEDLDNFELHGVANLRGASMQVKDIGGVVADQLQGALSFDRKGVYTRGIDGRLLGGPVHVVVQAGKGRQVDTTEVSAQGEAQASAIMAVFKDMPAGWLEGSTTWRLDGRIPNTPTVSTAGFALSLHSDLTGLVVKLPDPLAKDAGDELPLGLTLKLTDPDDLAFNVDYGDDLQARLNFRPQGDAWGFDRGDLHLGEGDATLPANPGFILTGSVDSFAWDDWKPWIPKAAGVPPGTAELTASKGAVLLPPEMQGADLTLGRLQLYGQTLDKLHLVLTRSQGGWQARLDSPAVAGTLGLPAIVDADHPLMLDMDRLLLVKPPEAASVTGNAATAVVAPATHYDPRRIPALHFTGRRLEYGDLKLGGASFNLNPLQDGVAVEDLKVDSQTFGISGDGTWTVTPAGLQHSTVNLDVKSRDVGKSLQALGFAPAITGSKGEINAALNWQDSPFGDLTHTLAGSIKVDLEDGQIVDVQPGAGRVFGLLSLSALPRRLLLNFSDVFSKGFGYDSIQGDFTLQDGDAYTKDLQIKGPAARITLIGRTGIAKRDFDEALIVDANVGSTLPVVAGLAAGLVPGAVVLLLTQIFKKPLTAVGESRYHLTGTWDNPVLAKQNESTAAPKQKTGNP